MLVAALCMGFGVIAGVWASSFDRSRAEETYRAEIARLRRRPQVLYDWEQEER